MKLETLLKEIELLYGKKQYEPGDIARQDYIAGRYAPILVEVIRKLVEQRDGYAEALNLPTTNSGRKDNADLDTIVAKRLKGEE